MISQVSRGVQSVLRPGHGRFVWLSLTAPHIWARDHAPLSEGWGSMEARRLAEAYLYVYTAPAAVRRGGKGRRRRR